MDGNVLVPREVFARALDRLAWLPIKHPQQTADWHELKKALSAAPAEAPDARPSGSFQSRVHPWMMACFGPEISSDITERNHRFLEESLELVQALGCTRSEAHQLVDYTFDRPRGEAPQEVGGVMVTLAALCLAAKMDMDECGETELRRIWTKVDQIRAKQAAKPKDSPLPQHHSITAPDGDAGEKLREIEERVEAFERDFEENSRPLIRTQAHCDRAWLPSHITTLQHQLSAAKEEARAKAIEECALLMEERAARTQISNHSSAYISAAASIRALATGEKG